MVFFVPSAYKRINYIYSESESLNSIRINERSVYCVRARCHFTKCSAVISGVPRGFWGVQPPPEIPKAIKNRAKLNPIVKTVKNC